MLFREVRDELLRKQELQRYKISAYGNAGGRKKNDFLQIFLRHWMPCKFYGIPLELHFEIQSDRIFRLDCHWYIYGEHKNYKSKEDLLKAFPNLNGFIEKRQKFIRKLSAEAQSAYPNKAHIRQVRFNALSGIEWKWDDSVDWKDIADEIVKIVTAVTPCVVNHFNNELS